MYLQEISNIAIFIAVFLFLLAWLLRDRLKIAYVWLIQHKKGFLIGAVICQFVMMVCAELFIRRDAAVVFKGAFDLLKQSSITNYLSRNPNNIPLFLYEKFFYVIFGSSGHAASQHPLCQFGCRPLVQAVPEAFQSTNS